LSGALIVFAKRPEPGRVKTRLTPPFTSEQAAGFYAAMLEDVLEASAGFAAETDLVPILAIDPASAVSEFEARVPGGFRVVAQQGEGLSARMEAAALGAFGEGFAPVLLRGSDSPTMTGETVAAALAALTHSDLVVCPDLDGGYNLVGLGRPAPGLFAHPMSTATVLEDTLSRARADGLECTCLDAGFDIDTVDDLVLLRRAISEGISLQCPRTVRYLDERGLWFGAEASES
jgi:rSAM/selenodomain-associated transferase 1